MSGLEALMHDGGKAEALLRKKFGDTFVAWLLLETATANFFVASSGLTRDQLWAMMLCLGYAFTAGKDLKND